MISTIYFLKKGVCAATTTQDLDKTQDEEIDVSSEGEDMDALLGPEEKGTRDQEMDGDSSDSENAFFEEYNYDPKKDPYVTSLVDESALDLDDHIIREDDYIVLTGVSETDEVSHLDLCLYEKEEDNVFTHHDYLLPAFPLALAWLDFPVGRSENERMNAVAVATFEPYIEIWDLDKTNTFPAAVLGGPADKSKIGDQDYVLMPESHQSSVLGLSWNKNQRNALASASADKTVKLWDLQSGSCVRTFNYHTNKVQAVEWNPVEGPILASGGFDSKIILTDVRLENSVISVSTPSEIESLHWLPAPYHNLLLASFENGQINCYDILQNMTCIWQLGAHTKPVHALAINYSFPGLIATGAPEKDCPLKIWDVSSGSPTCLYSKTSNLGPVFSLGFCPDDPFLLAVGTQETLPKFMDLSQKSEIAAKYQKYQPAAQGNLDFSTINYSPSVGIATKSTQSNQTSPSAKKGKKKGKKGGKK